MRDDRAQSAETTPFGPLACVARVRHDRRVHDPQACRVLVVDDEESVRHFVEKGLVRLGYEVVAVADGERALAAWNEQRFDAAVLDVRMPGLDGTAVLTRIRSSSPDAVVVLMSAHGTVDSAVEAMHLGAADFVTKPFDIGELRLRVDRAIRARRDAQEHRRVKDLLERPDEALGIVSAAPAMRELLRQVELAASADSTVLLTGESGTGKGLLAKALHLRSARREQPFVSMNCAAVPDALAESELFGHVAGAFTGARSNKAGLLQRANGGTLFLDEIGDMSLSAQAKIERFLQDREFVPLGGERLVRVDVRVVAATNRDLKALLEEGAFRRELFYRLDVVQLRVPALRERRDDVPPLIHDFLRRRMPQSDYRFTPEALGVLCAWHWPGNVRELENLIERVVVLAGDRAELGVEDLPAELRSGDEAAAAMAAVDDGYEGARQRFDRLYFRNLLRRTDGNVSEAARVARLSRGHLYRRLKELDVHNP